MGCHPKLQLKVSDVTNEVYLCTNDHILMYLIHIWVVGHCVGPDIANILGMDP